MQAKYMQQAARGHNAAVGAVTGFRHSSTASVSPSSPAPTMHIDHYCECDQENMAL